MKKFNLGIILGTLSGMSWGLNTVIIGIILGFSIFTPYSNNLFISALIVAFLHDFCSACWLDSYSSCKTYCKIIFTEIGRASCRERVSSPV